MSPAKEVSSQQASRATSSGAVSQTASRLASDRVERVGGETSPRYELARFLVATTIPRSLRTQRTGSAGGIWSLHCEVQRVFGRRRIGSGAEKMYIEV